MAAFLQQFRGNFMAFSGSTGDWSWHFTLTFRASKLVQLKIAEREA